MTDHPIRIVVTDDLRRSRLTVFFRGILAVPHYLWVGLIGTAVVIGVFIGWWIALFRGRLPDGLHEFVAGFLRYATHVEGCVFLAANPYPGFYPFDENAYPIDLEIGPNEKQSRWSILLRLFLALPALVLGSALVAGGARAGGYGGGGVIFVTAFLGWFASLVRGRTPRGLRDLTVYSLGYTSQVWAYVFLLTGRYPYSGPNAFAVPAADVEVEADAEAESEAGAEPHPVRMTVSDDLRRSRMVVFFRLPISAPHLVWFLLWSVAAVVASLLNWLSALAIGRSPQPFHRFLSAYLRYSTHLNAFFWLVGNPFPGFTGAPGRYPVEIEIDAPEHQHRLVTAFRLLLALPALCVAGSLASVLWVVGVLAWFASLVRGRMPHGLQNLGAYILRYSAQAYAYTFVITARYPHSGPRPDPASP